MDTGFWTWRVLPNTTFRVSNGFITIRRTPPQADIIYKYPKPVKISVTNPSLNRGSNILIIRNYEGEIVLREVNRIQDLILPYQTVDTSNLPPRSRLFQIQDPCSPTPKFLGSVQKHKKVFLRGVSGFDVCLFILKNIRICCKLEI